MRFKSLHFFFIDTQGLYLLKSKVALRFTEHPHSAQNKQN